MHKLIIYGAGVIGKSVAKTAKAKEFNDISFIDKYKNGIVEGFPIITEDEISSLSTNVIIVLTVYEERQEKNAIQYLKGLNPDLDIRTFHEMLTLFPEIIRKKYNEHFFWLDEGCQDAKDEFKKYFHEEKSISILKNWIAFRKTFDPRYYVNPDPSQYIPNDLNWIESIENNDVTLLDVGAYVGDCCEEFVNKSDKCGKRIHTYLGLEAEKNNFSAIKSNVQLMLKKNPPMQSIILPIGAWDENKNLYISSQGSASAVTEEAPSPEMTSFSVAKLDDVFINYPINVIKMDIEGAEKPALKGAASIIKSYSPVLLISLYHKPADLWEIPMLINKINPDYNMYVRVHAHMFLETVLYCIPKQGD